VVTLGDPEDPFVTSAVSGARATAKSLDASLDIVRSDADRLDDDVQDALAARPNVIVGVGAATLDAIDPAAASNLDQQFVVVGGEAPEPTANLTTAVFRSHEALHLTGVEAGLMSRSGTVGVVAPESDPLVDAWVETFTAGAESSGARVEIARVTGTDTAPALSRLDAASADVVQAVLLGRARLDRTSGRPSFDTGPQGCRDAATIDSVVTHADQALDATVREVMAGRPGGVHSFGLAEGTITLASLDGDGDCLISRDPTAMTAVRAAQDAIVDGTTTIPDPDFAH
jgi:basic membrane protein A